MATAATLFAYTSRIPIPLKESPTRTKNDLLADQVGGVTQPTPDIDFQETLRQRDIATLPQAQTDPIPPPPEVLGYYILAGIYEQADLAEQRKQTLSSELAEQSVEIEVRQIAGATPQTNLHWVLVGPFDTSSDADSIRGLLALLGVDSRIERLPLNNRTNLTTQSTPKLQPATQ